jgi:hypothetical protein
MFETEVRRHEERSLKIFPPTIDRLRRPLLHAAASFLQFAAVKSFKDVAAHQPVPLD